MSGLEWLTLAGVLLLVGGPFACVVLGWLRQP